MQWLATRARPRPAVRSFAIACVALVACAAAPVRAFDWRVEVTPGGELVPALQLSQTKAVGVGDGLVSVHIEGRDRPSRLRVRIETDGLRAPVVVEAGPDAGGNSIELRPRLDWDVARLRALRTVRLQPLRVTLEGDGHAPQVRTLDVRVHPLDEAVYFVREGRDRVDLGWIFATYVNPRDPAVDAVLDLARAIDPRFDAAASAPEEDLHRAAAVWAALQRRGLRYDATDPAVARGPVLWSQRVRAPSETWRDRRANCIDGSVLIASVLERIGIRASIVLVPGHAFVAFGGDATSGDADYLETTLLGAADFDIARTAGRACWRRVAARLDGRHRPDYARVDIGVARAYGIIPLAVDADAAPAAASASGSRQSGGAQGSGRAVRRASPAHRP